MRTIHSKVSVLALTILGVVLGGSVLVAQPVLLLHPTNTVWKFHPNQPSLGDPGYVPADAWVARAFDDTGWTNGKGLFGYESTANLYPLPFYTYIVPPNGVAAGGAIFPGQPGSPLSPGPQAAGTGPASSYFRVHFNWSGPTQNVNLTFTNYVDDAMAVYLNGVELFEFNMLARPVAWNNYDTALGANPAPYTEPSTYITNVTANLLPGDNVLAVQLQEEANTSSDDIFGMWMYGTAQFAPIILDQTQPTNRIVIQSRPTTLRVVADAFPAPTYQWFKVGSGAIDPSVNATATNASLVISNMASGDAGDYFAVVTNPLGMTNSRTATIGYMADTVAPRTLYASGSPTLDSVYLQFDELMDPGTATDPANYSISPPLTLAGNPTLANGGFAVILPTAPQTPGATYTVTVTDVYDFALNPIAAPNNTAQFRAWMPTACGGLTFEVYATDGSTAVTPGLTGDPDFPNNPREVFNITTFATDPAWGNVPNGDPRRDNYGGRIRGLFIPPQGGNWKFYLRADDGAEIWFNPNGISPSGRTRICFVAAFIGGTFMEEMPGARTSAPIPLNAGQAYYIEALYKEGIGGDYCEVAAKLESDPTPAASLTPIPGSMLGVGSAPPDVLGPVTILLQPSSRTNEANTQATFTVMASNALNANICYQWQRSDSGGPFADIPGGTGRSYLTPYLTEADDNGDAYRVVVSVIGSSATSATATLKVTPDVTRPRVTRVLGINSTNIVVFFSEPLSPTGTSVVDPDAYRIDDGANSSVGSALISPTNPLRVDLFLSSAGFELTLGNTYTLRVSTESTPLADDNSNPLNPDPTFVVFRAQNYTNNVENLIALPTAGRLPVGSLTDRGFAGRIVQVSSNIANLNTVTEDLLNGVYPSADAPLPNIAPLHVFYETNAINYNRDGPGTNTGSLTPDVQFPGYPPGPTTPESVQNNMAMEVITYLHLQVGIYQFGVASDDGFQVTPAVSVLDTNNNIILGQFNGGRGITDPSNPSLFNFFVSEAGLYPFRLTWEQGQGGANVEWFAVDLNSLSATRSAINGSPPAPAPGLAASPGGGGPPAFTPPCTGKRLSISLSGTNVVVTWPLAGGGNLFALQGTPSLSPVIAWSYVPQVPQNVGGNKRVTIPLTAGQNRFYRLYKAAPPNCP